jgi:hypothetical protein
MRASGVERDRFTDMDGSPGVVRPVGAAQVLKRFERGFALSGTEF